MVVIAIVIMVFCISCGVIGKVVLMMVRMFPIMGIRNGDGGGIDEGDVNYNDGSDDFHS